MTVEFPFMQVSYRYPNLEGSIDLFEYTFTNEWSNGGEYKDIAFHYLTITILHAGDNEPSIGIDYPCIREYPSDMLDFVPFALTTIFYHAVRVIDLDLIGYRFHFESLPRSLTAHSSNHRPIAINTSPMPLRTNPRVVLVFFLSSVHRSSQEYCLIDIFR